MLSVNCLINVTNDLSSLKISKAIQLSPFSHKSTQPDRMCGEKSLDLAPAIDDFLGAGTEKRKKNASADKSQSMEFSLKKSKSLSFSTETRNYRMKEM